jgi:hypothetical protein
MNDDKDKRQGQSAGPVKDPRQQRLGLALRENLKRRKSQARGREAFTILPSIADNLQSDGESDTPPEE